MKIRSVELTNFRKFVGTVKVNNIGDNVNVLVGRNELGKSTLLQAINGVIFEKAKSTAGHVRAFRHVVNGTVPEVKLAFDMDGKSWAIHKRFAGQAGKATLTCSDRRLFEDDAAEAELQRLLGFAGGRGGGEPGIWGTLWVQQGKSFGDAGLDEHGQRTMQGCLEAQVGAVTGGVRGQKIPKAVRDALEEIRSTRGPRGKFKDAIERLDGTKAKIASLGAKSAEVFQLMADLAWNKRELKTVQADWDETARRAEIDEEHVKRTAAATRAAEVSAARDAATLARERATRSRQMLEERTTAIEALVPLRAQLATLSDDVTAAQRSRADAKATVEASETRLSDLRVQASQSAERARTLERIRTAAALEGEIGQHQATLDKSASLETEAARVSEEIGSITATEAAVTRIEEAMAELSAAEAATNAVSTIVSFAIEKAAQGQVRVDSKPLDSTSESLAILAKTTVGIQGIGEIIVEPQIKNRNALLVRLQKARDELKTALEMAGVSDIAAARLASGRRKDLERRLSTIRSDMDGLAPGNRTKKLAPGLEALKAYLGQLRGRLSAELKTLKLEVLPGADVLARDVESNHEAGAKLAAEIATAEAALAGPQDLLAQADGKLRKDQERLAELKGIVATREADLGAGRASASDDQLAAQVGAQEGEAETREAELAHLQARQGETPEALDARIKRLEAAATNHHRTIATMSNEVTRLTTLIAANEGAGVEEALLAAEAEHDRLARVVAEFEQEAAVLQMLLEALQTAESEAKNRYLAPVVSRVEPYLKMLLPGADIVLDESLRIAELHRDGQKEDFEILSGGTQEQLAVLARIAFAELLLGQGRPATVILDDALVFSDDDRIENMFDVLMRAGARVQIIVLTCRRRLFTRLGAAPLEILKVAS
jgi:energy-coupling factor transporter ATP-binding protein EcfA2